MNRDRAPAFAPGPETFPPRRILLAAVAALSAAVLVFLVGVRTRWGQQFGDAALQGRLAADPELRAGSLELLDMIRRSSMVLMGGGIIAVAAARRQWRVAVVVTVVLIISIGGAELLKDHLHRPDFGIDPPGITANSAPSGHTTIAVSLVLCALMVVPVAVRRVVAVVGAIYAAAIASGTLAAGWHRPSDAVMAVCWSLSVALFGVVVLEWWSGRGADRHEVDDRLRRVVTVGAMALPVMVLAGSFLLTDRPVVWTAPSGRFFLAAGVIDVVAAGSVLLFEWCLRERSFERLT